jgi:sterol desaturase/sphingolipid hydroxylase (fatty acid hydroxylase superfamily)
MAKWFIHPHHRNEDPEPLTVRADVIAWIGIAGWLIALVVMGTLYSSLANANLGWWFTTAGFGILLGFIGLIMIKNR